MIETKSLDVVGSKDVNQRFNSIANERFRIACTVAVCLIKYGHDEVPENMVLIDTKSMLDVPV